MAANDYLRHETNWAEDFSRACRAVVRRARLAMITAVDTDHRPVTRTVFSACDLDGTPILGMDKRAAADLAAQQSEVTLVFIDEDPAAALGELYAVHMHGPLHTSTAARHALRFRSRHPDCAAQAFLTPGIRAVDVVAPDAEMTTLEPDDYRIEIGDAPELTDNEQANLEHQNQDHLDINEQLVTQLLERPPGAWLLTGLDPEGMDFRCGRELCRLPFEQPAFDRPALGAAIKGYVKIARAQLGIDWNP